MENPSTDLFYKLIKRNRGGAKQETACICLNGQDYYDPCEQRKCFLQYFEDLSIPKDKGYDNGYLELCNIRQKLITQIYSEGEAQIFFPEFNIRLYDKNSESDYFFFLHQNQNIFFSNIGNQNIFFRKKP
jgi:hypothetical protein